MMRLEILGGPFDGGLIDMPRRTRPGLRLRLHSDDASADYILVRIDGLSAVVLEELVLANVDGFTRRDLVDA